MVQKQQAETVALVEDAKRTWIRARAMVLAHEEALKKSEHRLEYANRLTLISALATIFLSTTLLAEARNALAALGTLPTSFDSITAFLTMLAAVLTAIAKYAERFAGTPEALEKHREATFDLEAKLGDIELLAARISDYWDGNSEFQLQDLTIEREALMEDVKKLAGVRLTARESHRSQATTEVNDKPIGLLLIRLTRGEAKEDSDGIQPRQRGD